MTENNMVWVNKETLAIELAESAWEADTHQIAEQDLYEWVDKKVEEMDAYELAHSNKLGRITKKQVRPIWTYLFFNLKDRYEKMIDNHSQK